MEFPTTAPFPTIALPRINAQWRISASSSIIHGPAINAVLATFAVFAIQTFSSTSSNFSFGSVAPNSLINALIFGSNSHGYSAVFNKSAAIVCSKSYRFLIFNCSILFSTSFYFFLDFVDGFASL